MALQVPNRRMRRDLLMTEVQRMREELSQARHRINYLEKLADEDTLVPAANRRAFVREMSRMVAYAERYGSGSSVLYFNVDRFKEINDQHGHAAGDAALRQIAELLAENVRETDIVGRLGGDEFGVILAQATAEVAAEKAASLSALIGATPRDWEGTAITLSVSYGVYSFTGTEDAGRHCSAPIRRCTRRSITARPKARAAIDRNSGDDVGQQLAFDILNFILKTELSLFQTLDLQLVERLFVRDAPITSSRSRCSVSSSFCRWRRDS